MVLETNQNSSSNNISNDQIQFMVKRNSYNGKQMKILNKLTEQAMHSNSNSTAAVTDIRASPGMAQSMYDDSIKTIMEDSQIRQILQNNINL
jgi:hypothetical protein